MKSIKELFKKKSTHKKSDASNKEKAGTSQEEVVHNKPLFSPAHSANEMSSNARMNDLSQVGKTKALGYMPLDEIRSAGFDPFHVSVFLKKQGLKTFVIPVPSYEELYAYNPDKNKYIRIADKTEYKVIPKGGFLSIRSGALVAYDEEAVNSFLKKNEELIREENNKELDPENHWPLEAEGFVNMVFRKKAESIKMNYLVQQIFEEMPGPTPSNTSTK